LDDFNAGYRRMSEPTTPETVIAEADRRAQMLMESAADHRRDALREMRRQEPVLHDLVMSRMDQLRREARRVSPPADVPNRVVGFAYTPPYPQAGNQGSSFVPIGTPVHSNAEGRLEAVQSDGSIHVDSQSPRPAAMATAGMRYAPANVFGNENARALARDPMIVCPRCSRPVLELGGGDSIIGRNRRPYGGHRTVGLPNRMSYTLVPCGCRVHQEWAQGFGIELHRRLQGLPAALVIDMPDIQRDAQVSELVQLLVALDRGRAGLSDPAARLESEYRMTEVLDQIHQIHPQAAFSIRLPPISREVQAWAARYLSAPLFNAVAVSDGGHDAPSLDYGAQVRMPNLADAAARMGAVHRELDVESVLRISELALQRLCSTASQPPEVSGPSKVVPDNVRQLPDAAGKRLTAQEAFLDRFKKKTRKLIDLDEESP